MKNTINVGLFSYGMSGRVFHAPLLHALPGFTIKKILQRTSSDAAATYPYVEVVRTAGELLNDPQIDLIVVNTPDHTHFDFTCDALNAGKHVVVEKPFVQKQEEGEQLIELAKKRNKLLTVFQNRRWEGDFLTVQHVIQNSLLGRLVDYEARFDRFRNYIRDSWKEKPENNTGTLYNLGSHLIDQALQLFGLPDGVSADLRMQRTNSMVDDSFDLLLMYSQVKVGLKGSYLVREPGPRFKLNGTEGSFVKFGTDPQEADLQHGRFPDEEGWGTDVPENWGLLNTTLHGIHFRGHIETIPGCYQEFYRLLYEAMVNGRDIPVNPLDSLNGIRVIQAAFESHKKGCVIAL